MTCDPKKIFTNLEVAGTISDGTKNLSDLGSFTSADFFLTKITLFLGTQKATRTDGGNATPPDETYIPFETDGVEYFFFPNRDSGNGLWSDNKNPEATGATSFNLIG